MRFGRVDELGFNNMNKGWWGWSYFVTNRAMIVARLRVEFERGMQGQGMTWWWHS